MDTGHSRKLENTIQDYSEFLEIDLVQEWTFSLREEFWLPVSLIEQMVDTSYLDQLRVQKSQYLADLQQSIKINGLRRPGALVVSFNKIKLQDGNHRFICCKNLNHLYFPVHLQFSEGNMPKGMKLQELIPILFEKMYKI